MNETDVEGEMCYHKTHDLHVGELEQQVMRLRNQIEVYEEVVDELLKEKDTEEVTSKLQQSETLSKVKKSTTVILMDLKLYTLETDVSMLSFINRFIQYIICFS